MSEHSSLADLAQGFDDLFADMSPAHTGYTIRPAHAGAVPVPVAAPQNKDLQFGTLRSILGGGALLEADTLLHAWEPQFRVGEVLDVKWLEDGLWYAGRIDLIDVEKRRYMVTFIEYGNSQDTLEEHIRHTSKSLYDRRLDDMRRSEEEKHVKRGEMPKGATLKISEAAARPPPPKFDPFFGSSPPGAVVSPRSLVATGIPLDKRESVPKPPVSFAQAFDKIISGQLDLERGSPAQPAPPLSPTVSDGATSGRGSTLNACPVCRDGFDTKEVLVIHMMAASCKPRTPAFKPDSSESKVDTLKARKISADTGGSKPLADSLDRTRRSRSLIGRASADDLSGSGKAESSHRRAPSKGSDVTNAGDALWAANPLSKPSSNGLNMYE